MIIPSIINHNSDDSGMLHLLLALGKMIPSTRLIETEDEFETISY